MIKNAKRVFAHPLIMLGLVAATVLACGSTGAEATAVSGPPDGEVLYKKYCVLCHGTDGKKGFNGAGDLTKSVLSLDERVVLVREGKGMMTPYKEMLSEEEIRAVAAYTLQIKA
jgi:cytochrome c6